MQGHKTLHAPLRHASALHMHRVPPLGEFTYSSSAQNLYMYVLKWLVWVCMQRLVGCALTVIHDMIWNLYDLVWINGECLKDNEQLRKVQHNYICSPCPNVGICAERVVLRGFTTGKWIRIFSHLWRVFHIKVLNLGYFNNYWRSFIKWFGGAQKVYHEFNLKNYAL